MNVPWSLVSVSRWSPVCWLLTVTLTLAITAPVESLTTPVICPVAVWARDVPANPSTTTSATISRTAVFMVSLRSDVHPGRVVGLRPAPAVPPA